MLTLKGPIQLHTTQPLTMASKGFGERIIGNYNILGAKYEPKDLLFLLTAPQELPEDLGGMTTLVEDTSVNSVQNVTMDVVNHVVNRILLDGSSQFTYQDQVYITSVLNRLGITNVAQFMEEVRRLRVENESVVHMTQLYQTQLRQLLARQAAGEESVRLPLPAEREGEDQKVRTRDPGLTMALSILNRLDTPRIYETVHAFRQNWTVDDSVVQQNTLRLTEQLRFSNAIELAEMKHQVFQEPEITLLNHWNRYEHYDVAVPAATEAQVLRQAAAAALLTAVDNTLVEVLNCPRFHQQWLHVERGLWQTAENTLNRFEAFHSWESLSRPEAPPPVDRQWRYYAQELQEYETLEREVMALPESRLPLPVRESTPVLPPQPVRSWPAEPVEREFLTSDQAEAEAPELLTRELSRIDRENRERLERVTRELHSREMRPPTPPARPDLRRTMRDALRALDNPEEVLSQLPFTQAEMTTTPVYSPEEEAVLKQASPEERALYERVLAVNRDPEAAVAQGLVRPANMGSFQADLMQAKRDQKAVMEHPQAPEQEMEEGAKPSEAAPETERARYEQLLAAGLAPEGTLARSLARSAGISQLREELQQEGRERRAVMEHLQTPEQAETERLIQRSETVLERFQQLPGQQVTVLEPDHRRAAIQFVHKEAPPDISEELIERLQENRTQSQVTRRTEDRVVEQQSHTTNLSQTQRQTVNTVTTDVTELVNRTLASQMRTISDQVYRQMEKKLQLERSRRGRF